ncbi:hypothetical protein [Nocardioides sp. TF02-7]|uniref:hypothetical protein n=1 Tax=Nocardioides sp. TF02-7 TaxID=2917724 RepID=UPI001F05E8ED|nr:hypothetical protein [Nocardioides sp. TF02-7]UMG94012.1 hypothetical protein MF408_08020 [Nocardioides sp. TF02-7]
MVVLGVLLLVLGVVGLAVSFFGADVDADGSTEIMSWHLAPGTLVLWGAVSTLLVVAGLWSLKVGAKQGWRHRQEQKRLRELSDRLERAEGDHRTDGDDERR